MDPITLGIITGVTQSIIGGIGGWLQHGARTREQAAQAEQLRQNMIDVQEYASKADANLAEIENMINSSIEKQKGEFKVMLEGQRDRAIDQINTQMMNAFEDLDRQYEKVKHTLTEREKQAVEQQQEQLREYRGYLEQLRDTKQRELGQRRLLGSKASQESFKQLEKQQGEAEEQISKQREDTSKEVFDRLAGLSEDIGFQKRRLTESTQQRTGDVSAQFGDILTGRLMGLEQQRLQGVSNVRGQRAQLGLDTGMQLTSLGNMASTLQRLSEQGPFADIFAGASGGAGQALGNLIALGVRNNQQSKTGTTPEAQSQAAYYGMNVKP